MNRIAQTDITKTRENGKLEYIVWAKRTEGAWYVVGVYATRGIARGVAARL